MFSPDRILAAVMVSAALSPSLLLAQSDFPNKPIRIVVANTPGSTVDLVARHLAERLQPSLGQPIVILNQPGAAGLVGLADDRAGAQGRLHARLLRQHRGDRSAFAEVARVRSDQGHHDGRHRGQHPVRGGRPKDSPYQTLAQLIDAAKRSPGSVKLGSAGSGTAIHLAGMQFQSMAGIDMLHVPYKGVAPLQTALLAGEIDVAFPTVGSVAGAIKDGRLRALGTTSRQRTPALPQVPTIAEAGLSGYEFESWLALVAPSGVPAPILRKLGEETRAAAASEAMQKMFADNSISPEVVLGDAAQRVVVRDYEVMGPLVRKSGATAN